MSRSHTDILQAMPGTKRQLVDRSGWPRDTVQRAISRMVAGVDYHIPAWAPAASGTGPRAAVYHAGPGRCVPCNLRPLTKAERWQRYVTNAGRDIMRTRWRTNKAIRQGLHLRDPLQQAAFNLVRPTP